MPARRGQGQSAEPSPNCSACGHVSAGAGSGWTGAAPQIGWGLLPKLGGGSEPELPLPPVLRELSVRAPKRRGVAKGRAFVLRTGGKGVYFLLILPSPCDLSKPCVALRGGPEQQRLPPSCLALQRGSPSPAAAWCWGTAAWQQRACPPAVLVLLQGLFSCRAPIPTPLLRHHPFMQHHGAAAAPSSRRGTFLGARSKPLRLFPELPADTS